MPTCSASSAHFPSAQAEPGRWWNSPNKIQPNPAIRPDGPTCTHALNWFWNGSQELDIENDDSDDFGGSQYAEGDAVMLAAEDEGEERLREAAIVSSVRDGGFIA